MAENGGFINANTWLDSDVEMIVDMSSVETGDDDAGKEEREKLRAGLGELVEDKLVLLAHPLSPVKTRIFLFQKEAEIVGQVTGVAMRIVLSLADPGDEISKAPSQS